MRKCAAATPSRRERSGKDRELWLWRRLMLRGRDRRDEFGEALYDAEQRGELPEAATLASLGCGNPIMVADLHEGETVLDLGSGGGIDVILSAKRVGETGLAFGLDMTDEMLALARANAREAGIRNAVFLKGVIEEIPLPADSVDVVISNCVINLSTDKPAVLTEIARVLTPRRPNRDQRRRRRGPALRRGAGGARQLRRLHRGCSVQGRVRGGPRGSGFRRGQRRVHPRGRRRHARRDRQGGEDDGAGVPGTARDPTGCERGLLLRP